MNAEISKVWDNPKDYWRASVKHMGFVICECRSTISEADVRANADTIVHALNRELHLAKSPVVASEAAKAAAGDICDIENICIGGDYTDPTARAVQPDKIAAIITRHFQPVLEENERLRENEKYYCGSVAARDGDIIALRVDLATLNKELEKTKAAEARAKDGGGEWCRIANKALTDLAQCQQLREGDNELIRALAESVGIKITAPNTLLGVQWEQFHDGVRALYTDRDTLRSQLAQAEGKVEAMREALTQLYSFPGVRDLLAPKDSLGSVAALVESALTPEAGERTT
jgi:hypothetical protein